MQTTPIALTTAQLLELGAAAADRGEPIYDAEIRSGLTSAELLEFEAGYFARQFAPREQVADWRVHGFRHLPRSA